ncbi:MAG: DUF1848 domain-containing protein [Oscillospiraceae bacterium]|nr:DUF1848 domain-containing protein [Oscillospiraceae bacterium]
MILSASRRTDIPSYYSEWFINRLREGYVLIPNPYNARRLSRLRLSPDTVDCIVFWSKNPAPMLPRLDAVTDLGYSFYFQFTLTPYGPVWEPGLPEVSSRLDTLLELSKRLGRERAVWRYDPIIVEERFPPAYHVQQFEALCRRLEGAVDTCVISFVDQYAHNRAVVPVVCVEDMRAIAGEFSAIAKQHKIRLSACCEDAWLAEYGVEKSACIDQRRIETILGCPIQGRKDAGQRPACGCMESVDVGIYGTCLNGCRYCYATKSPAAARRSWERHDPASPLLTGRPRGDETVTERRTASFRETQLSLL